MLAAPILLLAITFSATPPATPTSASPSIGEAVYKSASESIFQLEVLDDANTVISIGSAFLVGPQKLITNYHVISNGKPHLRVGAIRLECSISKVDPLNDLALVEAPTAIAAEPLKLSSESQPVGAQVYAIGNPRGLERTITEGLISGQREIDGRTLLQISASISPGSSGGPILNSRGEVVGVAVGFLENGQNLNFAVPVQAVTDFLRASGGVASFEKLLSLAQRLNERLSELDYTDPEWDATEAEIESTLQAALRLASSSPENLMAVAEFADENYRSSIAIQAANALLQETPKTDDTQAHRILARNLEQGMYFLSTEEREVRLGEAFVHAQTVLSSGPKPLAEDLFLAARILERTKERSAEARPFFQRSLEAAKAERKHELRPYLRGLFRTAASLREAESWLNEIARHGGLEEFDWANWARRLDSEKEYRRAAEAWGKAAELSPTSESLCEAGQSYWLASLVDSSLSYFRRCIEAGSAEEGSEERLAKAYSLMSSILFDRGVYDQSIIYAKQALALAPQDPWAYYNLSRSLSSQGRSAEAVSAAESAIRLSDGAFGTMHFALGSAYFDLQQWDRATTAFQKAAELEQADWAAAYNVALCFQRSRFFLDAARWYEEVLRRKPDHPEREELLKRIASLRK